MTCWRPQFIYIFLFLISISQALNRQINLNGKWDFKSSNGSVSCIGTVPGDIFSDLFHCGKIASPIYGENHLHFQWVSQDDWVYSRTFQLENVSPMSSAFLDISGLDTVATVYLNNKKILQSNNQFLSYHINVTDLIRFSENVISITFKSPVLYAEKKANEFYIRNGHNLPPVCNPEIYHGECHQNFIRKAQYSFGWDWGPSFPTMGITGNISINLYEINQFHDFYWTTELIDGFWIVNLKLETIHIDEASMDLFINVPDLEIFASTTIHLKSNKHKQTMALNTVIIHIPSEKVELWWPNNMGTQKLYNITVSSNKQVKTKYIGFRTVELIQDYIDSKEKMKGRHFYFKVNNIPVFLKGSNWIPVSMFPGNETNMMRMRFLLDSAVEVGMNVLRVWGGGFYESEQFYNYANRKGIMIWQDLMFACALYPTDKSFLKNVEEEVNQQIHRLSVHPSIIVFAGNNENEAVIRGHWWKEQNYTEAEQVHDYQVLYNRLAKVVRNSAKSTPFVMSSPSNGIESERAGGVSEDPYNVHYGDIHYYNEFVNLWRDDSYLTPRCSSEYGVQSYPLRETMLKWINNEDWQYTSTSLFHRQHHPGAIATNLLMIFSHLPIPEQCPSTKLKSLNNCGYIKSEKYMSRLAYFSQIHQAIALKTQTFHYRRYRNITTKEGVGNTMCAMYWQLNDVWAAPTWSSIDFELKWKMAHYEARRFFNNIAIYSFADENDYNLNTFVINDELTPILNHTVNITMLTWSNGMKPIWSNSVRVSRIEAQSSYGFETRARNRNEELSDYLYISTLLNENGDVVSTDFLIPDFLFEIDFSNFGDVQIDNIRKLDEENYEITLTTDKISPFTWIDIRKDFIGWFSDNAFIMTERLKTVKLHLKSPANITQSDFTVCNLKNCYL